MTKKILSCLIAVCFTSILLTACGKQGSQSTGSDNAIENNKNKVNIVTTTFPQYDWVRQILGEKTDEVELTLLIDDGVDLHSYQPSVEDIAKVANCDMFIYVGGESDGWVDNALETATNNDMIVVNMMDTLGDRVKEEEIVEGMEHDEHEDDEHHESEDHESSHGEDEHIWLSLKNAQILCKHISSELEKIDAQNAAIYRANADAYSNALGELDEKYQHTVTNAPTKTLLFGDRFPFRYLVDDYGISYYAAFSGCSAETEASFETIVFLSDKIDELDLHHVMVIDDSDKKIAQTIAENTTAKNQKILALNSMQSVTAQDISSGSTYLSIMEKNLEVLKEALK